jgi:PhnB protein
MHTRSIKTSIAPWLSVKNSINAVEFYKSAFLAVETYRLDVPGGVIARLAINGAEFWISDGNPETENSKPEDVGGGTVRLILTIENPDQLFQQAIKAGATEIFPVGEGHGWRLGRLADPFGLHWEIGYPLNEE